MGKIVLVTGGARSGKSTFAETMVKEMGKTIGYIATAKITDDDMARRIEHHKKQRPSNWSTFERFKDFTALKNDPAYRQCDTLLLDCITILTTNLMFDVDVDYDQCTMDEVEAVEAMIRMEIDQLLKLVRETRQNIVIVSNEVGLGLVPPYRLGNLFRDIAGRMNQMIAKEADEAYFIVSGLPIKLK